MKFRIYSYPFLFLAGITVFFSACFNDLDTIPLDPDEVTSAVVYDDPNSYRQVLAKLYAGLAVTGQQGPAGQADISGIDEGFGQYLRMFWYHQELSTDEAVIGWNDQTIKDFHEQDWTPSDNFIAAFYARVFYQISVCNEFIRETTDSKLDSRNVDGALRAEVQVYRAEARFLRALSYFHALDQFRNVPFVTEEDAVGAFFPEQIQANDLYNYIESELLAIEGSLLPPNSNEYARADQAAAWMLLAKLYLNAEVYIGKENYAGCLTYCEKVANAGFELEPEYKNLFLADNHTAKGIIFPIAYDGVHTKTYGGTTFIINASIGGSMDPSASGSGGGWGGTRTTSALVSKFPAASANPFSVAKNEGTNNYPVIYAPGTYQGSDPADPSSLKLASALSNNIYEGYLNVTDANTGIFFTLQPNLNQTFGDNNGDGVLDLNGANIEIASPGFYRIVVNINTATYTIERTDWGLIGSSTADGWDSDQNMTFDATENAWVIDAGLTEGEIKFRANDDWAINLGDDALDGLLEYGGGNIKIPANGSYRIKLYLDRPNYYTYSIEQTAVVFDTRAIFYTDGQTLDINNISEFTEGYAVNKFKNVKRDGSAGSDLSFADTDFPVFRLADAYLMYAEAFLRGGGGDMGTALNYVNAVRDRAYQSTAGRITASDLTLDFILDERARELYWECHRRTDLVRFGKFSQSDYLWQWKGGVMEGASTPSHLDVFPIPATDLGANPNLKQNTGY
ncbi:MAG: RagB/SusD family nutrient uptake outer membrane protein [Saprospiraceae bacterium]